MNKKTLSKIAAIGLAGLTVIPSFGIVASADVTVNAALATISGTANHVKWQINSVTKTIKADYNATTNALSFNENYMYVADYAVDTFETAGYAGTEDVYYASSQQASSVLSGLNNTITAENANGTSGSVAYNEWRKSWTNYQSDVNKFNNALATFKQRKAIEEAGGAAATEVTYVDSTGATKIINDVNDVHAYTAPADTTTLIIYSLTSSNDVKNMTQLEDDLGPKVGITNGEIVAGGDYTISTTGSSTGTTTGSTTNSSSVGLPVATYRTASDTAFKSTVTGYYYPNLSALRSVEPNATYTTSSVAVPYSSTNCYFDPVLGYYTSANTTGYAYVVSKGTVSEETAVYKVNGYYYATYTAAYNAANGNSNLIQLWKDYTTLPSNYFSQVTGSFYSTYADALKASGNNASRVTVFNNASIDDTNYLDPYYYYWLNKQQSSTSKDTSSATLGKRTGWTSIANYLSKVSSGSSATIAMNDETTVPASVLAAIKGRNVTVKFVLDNGATFTVNGKDVTSAKNVDIDVTYNTKSISKKLIQTAYSKNDAVSSAQLSIDAASLGFNSDLTVKFSSKRAGYKAKIYRYNASRNSLVLVDTATVGSNGKTTFDNITKGGEFVVVLYK